MNHRRCRVIDWAQALAVAAVGLATWFAIAASQTAVKPVELVFAYSSEKKDWLVEVNEAYRKTNPTENGRPVVVRLVPMGSGETIGAVLNAEPVTKDGLKADLISPASRAYLVLGDARAKAKGDPPLVAKDQSLVRSPVVIAMWKSKARALGWPEKPIGWKTLKALADPKAGWASVGHPEWHDLKFGHTHPEQSNSGLITLLSEAYAAAGKKQGLTVQDVEAGAGFLTVLESASPVYGRSTGFFADQMFGAGGDSFANAAVLYENLVIESYGDKYQGKLQEPVVAIYPEEGTFWSDHPVGLVQRKWVTDDPDKGPAAERYIAFLLQPDQQKKALLTYGFRPAVKSVTVGPPIDTAHGVDPSRPGPKDELQPPDADVMEACLKVWRSTKRKAHVVLVIDASNGMNMRLAQYQFIAQDSAKAVVDALADGDAVSILTFNDKMSWLVQNAVLSGDKARQDLKDKIDNGIASQGGRHVYDAIAAAHEFLKINANSEAISAMVVLTKTTPDDGSGKTLAQLTATIQGNAGPGDKPVYPFIFAYGTKDDPGAKALKAIAATGHGDARFEDLNDKASEAKIRDIIKAFAYLF